MLFPDGSVGGNDIAAAPLLLLMLELMLMILTHPLTTLCRHGHVPESGSAYDGKVQLPVLQRTRVIKGITSSQVKTSLGAAAVVMAFYHIPCGMRVEMESGMLMFNMTVDIISPPQVQAQQCRVWLAPVASRSFGMVFGFVNKERRAVYHVVKQQPFTCSITVRSQLVRRSCSKQHSKAVVVFTLFLPSAMLLLSTVGMLADCDSGCTVLSCLCCGRLSTPRVPLSGSVR